MFCTLRTVPSGIEKKSFKIRGRIDARQIIALSRSGRIMTRVLDTRGDLLSLRSK